MRSCLCLHGSARRQIWLDLDPRICTAILFLAGGCPRAPVDRRTTSSRLPQPASNSSPINYNDSARPLWRHPHSTMTMTSQLPRQISSRDFHTSGPVNYYTRVLQYWIYNDNNDITLTSFQTTTTTPTTITLRNPDSDYDDYIRRLLLRWRLRNDCNNSTITTTNTMMATVTTTTSTTTTTTNNNNNNNDNNNKDIWK